MNGASRELLISYVIQVWIGKYTLRIRAVSKEEQQLVFEERVLTIMIARPLWLSFWAILGYVILALSLFVIIYRVLNLKKQKKNIR